MLHFDAKFRNIFKKFSNCENCQCFKWIMVEFECITAPVLYSNLFTHCTNNVRFVCDYHCQNTETEQQKTATRILKLDNDGCNIETGQQNIAAGMLKPNIKGWLSEC